MEGYPWKQSVAPGETLSFSVSTTAQSFTADVYRLGWYGGAGARFLKPISNIPGHFYPLPQMDPATGLMDAKWPAAFSLSIDPTWTTGKYLIKLTGSNGKQGYIPFVVRSIRKAALLFVLSDNTAQAYNDWGGKSTYSYNSSGIPAYKVSFNRPYATGDTGKDVTFVWEYPMIRWLEKQGYDVEYASSVDLAMDPSLAENRKGVFVAGHSEYWSREMFNNLLAALESGVNLAFFSGDNISWRVRYENASNNPNPIPNRILVAYKSATADTVKNSQLSTTKWGVERTQLLGNDGWAGSCNPAPCYNPLIVTNAASWIYAGTGAKNGDLIGNIVGYEWDNATSTANMVAKSSVNQKSTLYKATSGAYVFDASTIEWPWGLDPWGTPQDVTTPLVQKITENILDNYVQSSLIKLPPATPIPAENLLRNGSFENPGTNWLSPWIFSVQGTATAAITQDKSTQVDGHYSARATITRASTANTDWYAQLLQANIPITAGRMYTLSFWAKAAMDRPIRVALMQAHSPWTVYFQESPNLTPLWHHYVYTFIASHTDANTQLVFNLAQQTGDIWINNVSMKNN